MLYDLHVHTAASDGIYSPQDVIGKAVEVGLAGLAITDHDTIDGLEPALEYIRDNDINIEFIPGIELNTDFEAEEVHILGYFIDYRHKGLNKKLIELRGHRYQRAEKMIDKLQTMGLHIDFNQVKSLAQGESIGRPHIARVLCGEGYAASEDEVFEKYIGRDMPAYVPRYKFPPTEAIALIKQAGGIAILAHPGLIKKSDKINEIIAMGIDGLEVYYPEHRSEQISKFACLAKQNYLLISGGSDYHGPGGRESRNRLGSKGVNKDMMQQIREYHLKKNKLFKK